MSTHDAAMFPGSDTTRTAKATVILNCNFEELQALASGASLLLDDMGSSPGGAVAAPAEALAHVAMLQSRLTGSLSVETLDEQRRLEVAVRTICTFLHDQMDEKVVEYHPAHEEAVATYFEYAHTLAVLNRLEEMGAQMAEMVELITGGTPDRTAGMRIPFPD